MPVPYGRKDGHDETIRVPFLSFWLENPKGQIISNQAPKTDELENIDEYQQNKRHMQRWWNVGGMCLSESDLDLLQSSDWGTDAEDESEEKPREYKTRIDCTSTLNDYEFASKFGPNENVYFDHMKTEIQVPENYSVPASPLETKKEAI
ncbi:hypothetical protein EVAR_101056_1 [Eumeta japonica]|uniref:Uncharacterized protein n=1 Tax=Eumeta variegata TaxID=151549 RepID=A0A4C1T0W4_EUMVA|nr:hypothetical protein EVAR_101056_1 [Eumeta japonica]